MVRRTLFVITEQETVATAKYPRRAGTGGRGDTPSDGAGGWDGETVR